MEQEIKKPYLTKLEVSKRLNCSLITVDRLMKDGKLPHLKLFSMVRFREKDIEHLEKETVRSHTLSNK